MAAVLRSVIFPLLLSALPVLCTAFIDDAWRTECVKWTNAMRAREGLPVLRRWTAGEACLRSQSEYDAGRAGQAGAGPGQGAIDVKCIRAGTNLDSDRDMYALHAYPPMSNTVDNVRKAIGSYWTQGKAADSTTDWASATYFENLVGRKGQFDYNAFDSTACGFAEASDGSIYFTQAFWGPAKDLPRNFTCGGCTDTKPCQSNVTDCSVPGNYANCSLDYQYLGCTQSIGCDPGYSGPCVNRTAQISGSFGSEDFSPCDSFTGDCAGILQRTGRDGNMVQMPFSEYCRPVCSGCACPSAGSTRASNPCPVVTPDLCVRHQVPADGNGAQKRPGTDADTTSKQTAVGRGGGIARPATWALAIPLGCYLLAPFLR